MKSTSTSDPSIQIADDIRRYLQSNNLTDNLPAITYEVLALQLIETEQREAEIQQLLDSEIDPEVINTESDKFDPIQAIICLKASYYDEACWLSFLLIYTNDSEHTDWDFMRKLYSGHGLNLQGPLTWQLLNDQPNVLNQRLETLAVSLAQSQPKPKFGLHRAYESLNHLPIVFSSYIDFINEQGGHQALFKPKDKAIDKIDYFKTLYVLVRQNIYRFGRLSTYEYLCLLGKLGLAEVEPDSCYIAEASGPKRGAKLLFGMLSNEQLDEHAVGLADHLGVGYQQLEAAICHWQKSPDRFIKYD